MTAAACTIDECDSVRSERSAELYARRPGGARQIVQRGERAGRGDRGRLSVRVEPAVHHRAAGRRDRAVSWLVTTALREAFKLVRRDGRELSLESSSRSTGDLRTTGRAAAARGGGASSAPRLETSASCPSASSAWSGYRGSASATQRWPARPPRPCAPSSASSCGPSARCERSADSAARGSATAAPCPACAACARPGSACAAWAGAWSPRGARSPPSRRRPHGRAPGGGRRAR